MVMEGFRDSGQNHDILKAALLTASQNIQEPGILGHTLTALLPKLGEALLFDHYHFGCDFDKESYGRKSIRPCRPNDTRDWPIRE